MCHNLYADETNCEGVEVLKSRLCFYLFRTISFVHSSEKEKQKGEMIYFF